MAKAFFIDTSRCIACRGCQVACKEWHGLPAVQTRQRGTHQNPPDLNPFTYKLVRFAEGKTGAKVEWLFFPDQCHHCLEPPCRGAADSFVPDAVIVDQKTGAVLYTEKTGALTAAQCKEIQEACPYDIPRRNEQSGLLTKCDMCIDRLRADLAPMCVKTCPTGAMNFGERDQMLAMAHQRLEAVKSSHPKAQLVDADNVSVIYLVTNPGLALQRPLKQAVESYSRRELLGNLTAPFRRIAG
ncbi:MAG: formate dehydrogenase [Syntrophobacteraceae bacterium]|nr:formate dehydrogenase [Syntrophobacteraceae bacterium]